MGFYGNMSDSNRSTLQFDKIYPNKTAMDAGCATDGVFVGRYVLVDYDYGDGDNDYSYNFDQDNGASVNKGRGWDSTVWKKVYQNGDLTYIMIAELNAVVPTLTQTTLAPSADGASVGFTPVTNVEYNLAIKAPWGMSIGDIDFNAAGFVKEIKTIESGNNTISVTPISSGTLYNGVREKDTYQLNINLPGIGNTISDVWDLIYGVDRNTEIRWGETTGHRAITINNGSINYNPDEMNTVAGIINSMHDLIGMNIVIVENTNNVNGWDPNKIYYIQNNGFYYKARNYYINNNSVDLQSIGVVDIRANNSQYYKRNQIIKNTENGLIFPYEYTQVHLTDEIELDAVYGTVEIGENDEISSFTQINDYPYKANTYYYKNNDNQYVLDSSNNITPGRNYYFSNRKDYKFNGYIAKPLPELSENLNTLHGLILAINKKLASGDQNVLDDTTVQGAINLLNKTRIELSGIVNGDSEYITATSDSNGATIVSHKTLSSRGIASLIDVSNDTAKYSYYPTVDGAGHVTAINRKEITLSALGIDSINDDIDDIKEKMGYSSITGENETLKGDIGTLQTKIGNVGNTDLQTQVTNIDNKIGASSDTSNNTVYGAINAVSAKIGDRTNPGENTVYKAIADLNSTISDEVTTQLSEVTSLIKKQDNKIIVGDNDTHKIEIEKGINLLNLQNESYFDVHKSYEENYSSHSFTIQYSTWQNLEIDEETQWKIYRLSIVEPKNLRISYVRSTSQQWELPVNSYFILRYDSPYYYVLINPSVWEQNVPTARFLTGSYQQLVDIDESSWLTFGSRDENAQNGDYSISLGSSNIASGECSYAEGSNAEASGNYAHAQNSYTIAASDNQTVIGKYNIADTSNNYSLIIGNGSAAVRENALTVDWDGNVVCGKINNVNINTLDSNILEVQNIANQAQQMIQSFGSSSKWEVIVDNFNTTGNTILDHEAQFSDYAWLMLCGTTGNSNHTLGINIVTTEFIPTSLFQTGVKFSISGNDGTSRRLSVTYVNETTVKVVDRSVLNLTIIGFKI